GVWRQHFGETTGAASLGRGVPTSATPATTPTSAASPTSPLSTIATSIAPTTATPASTMVGTATATRTANSTSTPSVTGTPSHTATIITTPGATMGNMPARKTLAVWSNQNGHARVEANSEWQPLTEVRALPGQLADEIRRNVTGAVGRRIEPLPTPTHPLVS